MKYTFMFDTDPEEKEAMASFTREDYLLVAKSARDLHAHWDNNEDIPEDINRIACNLMNMVELVLGQQEGPRWWQP